MDGDGRWEVILFCPPNFGGIPPKQLFTRYSVVRLGDATNELVWIGAIAQGQPITPSSFLAPRWHDEGGGGVKALGLVEFVPVTQPDGRVDYRPSQTVAVFAWDRPGGVLRPRMLPKGGSVLTWTPPDGRPVKVAPEADLEPILNKLLPVPDGFGRVTASQPLRRQSSGQPYGPR